VIAAVDKSKILVARRDATAFVLVVGRGSFQNAGALKQFYAELLETGVRQYVVDMAECHYLDSTFLGTLTGLGMRLRENAGGKAGRLVIVNVDSRNLELMQNLGMNRLPTIEVRASGPAPDAPLEELKVADPSKVEIGKQMLEAHEQLVRLDPANADKFKDVLTYLKEDLGKQDDPS
jgi:anti-sigma B factor antagonist